VKKEKDSTALVVVQPHDPLVAQPVAQPVVQPDGAQPLITNNNVSGDHHVIHIQNNNANTTNNNVTNIIVYHPDMQLLNDHISKKDMKTMIQQPDFESLCNYGAKLLQRPENQCVRKTNLRSASNTVHVGKDKWDAQIDTMVLPKIVSSIAANYTDSIDKYKLAIQKTLEIYLADITCDGDHGDPNNPVETKRVRSCYKKTINHVSHILFNFTKEHMGAVKAQAILRQT